MKPRIVILGGGFCGLEAAKKLDRNSLDVTLVDPHLYFEYTPSVPKLLASPRIISRIRIPYHSILKTVKIVAGKADLVTPEMVRVGKEVLNFDYLVICKGVDYPILLQNTANVFALKTGEQALSAAVILASAKKVLVAGGGLIGTEIAGELVTKTSAAVTVVHPLDRLLERNPVRAGKKALRFLEKNGAAVIFGEKILRREGRAYITDKGRRIEADMAFWCAGIKSSLDFLSKDFSEAITERRTLQVNAQLQVEGFTNIFAGGDVTAVPEEKTAQNAERHGRLIARNILSLIQGKKMVPYGGFEGPLVISLGSYNGLFVWKKFVLSGLIPALVKKLIEVWVLIRTRWL